MGELLDWIPRVSPEFAAPYHLADWCEINERALTEPIRALCDVPIRHYKSETTIHGIVWRKVKDPSRKTIFLTHSLEAAQVRGKRLRDLARSVGIGPTKGYDTITNWSNDQGGGVVVMSADQSKLGYDCHELVFDDPIDEHDVETLPKRNAVDESIAHYTARCMRNGKPGPVLGLMSRWHPDDPIGRRLARSEVKWIHIHHPVIIDEGLETERAFAPEVWDLPALKAMRAEWKEVDPTESKWFAQLMGDPRPIGSDLFREPTLYTDFPTFGGFRVGYGADFSYTVNLSSDWFVLLAGRAYGKKLYLCEMRKDKIDPTLIEDACKMVVEDYGRGPIFSYQSGPEIGISRLLRERGVPIVPMAARYNKRVRAQRTIRRWNDSDILTPANATWTKSFLQVISLFRGNDHDGGDDEADALVSLADGLLGGGVSGSTKTLGKPGYSGM